MRYERLARLMQSHRDAMATHKEHQATYEATLSILQALASQEITLNHAQRLLGLQPLGADESTAALYRQAAASLRQLQREGL